jgi:hypothetical protein
MIYFDSPQNKIRFAVKKYKKHTSMLEQMKKALGILLAVCFLMYMTPAAISVGSFMVKEKKQLL